MNDATPIVGYRGWVCIYGMNVPNIPSDVMSLHSLTTHDGWPLENRFEAHCDWAEGNGVRNGLMHKDNSSGFLSHSSPYIHCECGIYILKGTQDLYMWLLSPGMSRTLATGLVAGWGHVIEHEEGWRVQYASILALIDDDSKSPGFDHKSYSRELAKTAEAYRVPIVNWDGAELMRKEYMVDGISNRA